MIKHILVPTDGSDNAWNGVQYAIALAKQYAAKLHGLHVVDVKLLEGPFLRDVSSSLGTAPYANYQGNIAMILEERGKAALDSFRRACEEAGVECDTEQVVGIVPRMIIEHSGLSDLIIMGRGGEHSEWLDGVLGSTTATVARRATQPVLVTNTGAPKGNRFLVAYDGSKFAQRALQTAANLAHYWNATLQVLAVGEKWARAWIDEARSYLEAHDTEVTYAIREGDPSESIISYIEEADADLLIMGAFGHSKVRELVVGSTTAYALNHSPCPVLLVR